MTGEYEEENRADRYWGFPSYKQAFDDYIGDMLDVEYAKDEEGNYILDKEGNPIPNNVGFGATQQGEWKYKYHAPTIEEADILRELINGARTYYKSNNLLLSIIMEELEPFFKDQQSADQVAKVIQNRISLYLSENS